MNHTPELTELKDKIQAEYTNGNMVFLSCDDFHVFKMEDFIKQDADGILYDLNHIEPAILADLTTPSWINNYAVAKVIRALKAKIEQLEKQTTPHQQCFDSFF